MKHRATFNFWKAHEQLHKPTQDSADRCFDLLKKEPRHPSLHLKKIGEIWSVRVSIKYRTLGADVDDGIIWFGLAPKQSMTCS